MVVDLGKIYIQTFYSTPLLPVDAQFKAWKQDNPSYKIWMVNDFYNSHDKVYVKSVYVLIGY